jgi:DNA-directed RNA polymerase subunit RPC12/RpoP
MENEMKQFVKCCECGERFGEEDEDLYHECEACARILLKPMGERREIKVYVCDECFCTHPCNMTDEDYADIKGEEQYDTWRER